MKEQDSDNTPTPMLDQSLASSTDSSDPKTITERYTVIDRLGQGGMGRVYTAYDSRLDRTVAIKILFGTVFKDDYWMRFQKEARAASKLKHPGIVQVLDFGLFGDNEPFLSMEFVDGKTLTDYLKETGPLEVEEVLSIIEQICESMEHAHKQGVLHRDLKPSNILVTGEGEALRVQILDFGIAKVVDDASFEETLTKTGQVVGSPRYMSPEQARGESVDGRTDVYSLGCITYELLTGQPPYVGQTAMETIAKHLFDDLPKLSDVEGVDFPEELEVLVSKVLAKDPDERYDSMATFRSACEVLLKKQLYENASEDLFGEIVDNTDSQKTNSSSNRRLMLSLMVGLVLITFLGATLYFAIDKRFKQLPRVSVKTKEKSGAAEAKPVAFIPSDTISYDMVDKVKKFAYREKGWSEEQVINGNGEDAVNQLELSLPDGKKTVEFIMLTQAKLDGKIARVMGRFPKLKKVLLERATLTVDGLIGLSVCKRLEILKLVRMKVEPSDLLYLNKLPSLEVLKFDRVQIDDSCMKALSYNKKLNQIKLIRCPDVTESSLGNFTNRSNFRILVWDCKMLPADRLYDLSSKYGVELSQEKEEEKEK